MSYSPFSGRDVVKAMVNSGIYEWVRTNGDHAILVWNPPESHDSPRRTVPVPLHDELREGTLKEIGEQAGMQDFQEFKAWIDRNS
ncbi:MULTISPECIES: type II toxin-antitoxin system HicA family toxin [Halobacterium]|uniref:type II toxin-antitoxin system HicA family toxin n=1 Tax=Halobacterium TaxID=2239 RepID=UPI001963E234|nr:MULTISPECIES: type II toxin-antitoxin system HicA family toxin [Halobacterium]MDL0131191.1 type II toxin-antitoxin system HicA family toxin [Halobacterium salinarum]MDL0132477.1 type II toxin-antitoxin system HicA family toxin [Halobacterium salinarum]MDL0143545.1 type II toxin-antitoxin system HicA family toxin [Halobacterium salinarum]QRY24847.1 type II toxin-antitoxin system HicA family toxin [Halobacterium sp. BOL4-2]